MELPTIVLPPLAYNLLLTGLAAAAGYHALSLLQALHARLRSNRTQE